MSEAVTTNTYTHESAPTKRYRITFTTSGPLAHISVLDLGRVWERSLRRAGIPLRYSQGFNPRPKIQFASPLPTGCGGAAEWLDIWLETPWEPADIAAALKGKTPDALAVIQVNAVPESDPALSEQLIATETLVLLREIDLKSVETAVTALLKETTLLRPKRGRRRDKTYDLRPLIKTLEVETAEAPWTAKLFMRLVAQHGATGRPDEVLAALGFKDTPRRCTRTRLILGPQEDK